MVSQHPQPTTWICTAPCDRNITYYLYFTPEAIGGTERARRLHKVAQLGMIGCAVLYSSGCQQDKKHRTAWVLLPALSTGPRVLSNAHSTEPYLLGEEKLGLSSGSLLDRQRGSWPGARTWLQDGKSLLRRHLLQLPVSLFFGDRVSLCSPGCSGTCPVD